jgi:hypothetical protein
VWTEQDDEEIEYGEWKELTAKETLAEERKVHPAKAIEGIPSGYLRQKRESDDKTGKNERNHPVDFHAFGPPDLSSTPYYLG